MTELIDKKKLLISFSGGRTSAYMTWWLLNEWKDRNDYDMVVCFANTGREREETLQFVNKCDKEFNFNTVWIEAYVIPEKGEGTSHIVTNIKYASRNGEPFEEVIRKYGIPNAAFLHCTRELKMQPIRSYMRSIGFNKAITALGIRSDEPQRLNWVKAKKEKLVYPFAQFIKVTKSDINLFWSKQTFDLELKSYEGNCDLCYKKGLRKLMTLVKDKPELADWWREMEQKYGNYVPDGRSEIKDLPITFFRNSMNIDDIIEESKLPFDPAKDDSKMIDMWKQQSIWDEYLDSNNGCTESCEVF